MPSFILEEFLPATLTVPPMNDEGFAEFCSEHPDLSFEMTADGELIALAPTHTLTGTRNSWVDRKLGNWPDVDGTGIVNDSSTGQVLPNGARRSPDASWVRKSELVGLKSVHGYWRLCPSFVVEIKPDSDRLTTLRKKMEEYMENGAELGWLIDPGARTVEIYRPNSRPELLSNLDSVQGEGPLTGFVLDLRRIWDPLS